MSELDLEQLKKEIEVMKRHQPLYRVLKEELTKLGYWKLKARGNPRKAYQVSRR